MHRRVNQAIRACKLRTPVSGTPAVLAGLARTAAVTWVPLLRGVQGFLGLALLAVSALSTIINILGGLTLGMAWIGLFVYFITGGRTI